MIFESSRPIIHVLWFKSFFWLKIFKPVYIVILFCYISFKTWGNQIKLVLTKFEQEFFLKPRHMYMQFVIDELKNELAAGRSLTAYSFTLKRRELIFIDSYITNNRAVIILFMSNEPFPLLRMPVCLSRLDIVVLGVVPY